MRAEAKLKLSLRQRKVGFVADMRIVNVRPESRKKATNEGSLPLAILDMIS